MRRFAGLAVLARATCHPQVIARRVVRAAVRPLAHTGLRCGPLRRVVSRGLTTLRLAPRCRPA